MESFFVFTNIQVTVAKTTPTLDKHSWITKTLFQNVDQPATSLKCVGDFNKPIKSTYLLIRVIGRYNPMFEC